MSCTPCNPCPPAPPAPTPPAPRPCNNGQSCDEVLDAHCVIYNGPNLGNIGVLHGDSVDIIIQKLNTDQGSQAIDTADSSTIILTGDGLVSTPLTANAKIDNTIGNHNFLKVNSHGMVVQVTECMIEDILNAINDSEVGKNLFCQIVQSCSGGYCGPATGLGVGYSAPNFGLEWTPFSSGNLVNQFVQYKKFTDTVWINYATLGASVDTATVGGLLANTLYQFRIESNCYLGGPSYDAPINIIGFACPGIIITAGYDSITVSFAYVPSDVTKYTINIVKTSDSSLAGTYSVDLLANPAISVSHSFTGLLDSTNYTIHVIQKDATEAYTNTCSSSITTTVAPNCSVPSDITSHFQ